MKKTLFMCLFILFGAITVSAQQEGCAEQVTKAINIAKQSCEEIKSNEICFGHEDVQTVINCDTIPPFAKPGDVIPVDATCALRTGAMQTSGEWGIALMKIPTYDTNHDISYILLGDVELQNASSDTSKLRIWVDDEIDIHSGPGSHYNIIDALPANTEIYANACNCTRNWLRIVLDDGRVGWVSASHVTVIGNIEDFPIIDADSSLYSAMQAFVFKSGAQSTVCETAPKDGILIQIPASTDGIFVQVNGIEMLWSKATAFLQSQSDGNFTIDVLDGKGTITIDDLTMQVHNGMHVVIPISDESLVNGYVYAEPYNYDELQSLPISLLPTSFELIHPDEDKVPHLIGQDICNVISGQGDTTCPIYFVNADGDEITNMDVEFVYAPQGDWTSEDRTNPVIVEGDNYSGQLAWDVSCFLGDANFISSITWTATITDTMGHVSEPFEVAFNCVDG